MNIRGYLTVSGLLFCLVGLGHLARVIGNWPIRIDQFEVPMAVSWIGIVVPGLLAGWAFSLLRSQHTQTGN
ncbi:MAG: hypothetical protein R3200_14210 [Xanthomonadales bacterium]|nr:hypothetical protein [Xanthomonadales bacterium]